MKRLLFSVLLCMGFLNASADHITGGEMYYTYVNSNGGNYQYYFTLKLFMRCNSGRQFPDPAIVSVFERSSNNRIADFEFTISSIATLQLNNNDPCITDPPPVCYEVAYYNFTLNLPPNSSGYIISSEVNYRINGIANVSTGQVGATYVAQVPGNPDAVNSSAKFVGSDLVVVCANNYFTYSFAATDANNDQIRYSFCAGYNSSSTGLNSPPGNPPYQPLNYIGPEFSPTSPLGPRVTIDPTTGRISGIAPGPGIYVVTVCAEEIRDGRVIAVQRKDLQINITSCTIAAARLEEDYMLCRDTRSINVKNLAQSPLITSWNWVILSEAGNIVHQSTRPELDYTFPVDGKYFIKLYINRGQPCSDSATAPVYVFPGMRPQFDVSGICFQKPTQFTDQSTIANGSFTRWRWDFGESSLWADTSNLPNPVYTYPTMGNKTVVLTLWANNGCRDTARRLVPIITKPPIDLAFKDTLICRDDVVQLQASGIGQFSWSPDFAMSGSNVPNPVVQPASTTKYIVTLDSDGCVNTDSVLVRVVEFVTLQPMSDTTICRGDTIQIRVNSDGLQYSWTPAEQVLTAGVREPKVVTEDDTQYRVHAVIGGCSADASVWVRTVPYPTADAGADTTICYNTPAQLEGTTNASTYGWAPVSSVTRSDLLSPLAYPVQTTSYILTVSNPGTGCPKSVSDTVLVSVLPKIIPDVGNDTSVIVGQPLQLLASGGASYQWSPSQFLDNPDIANPIALFDRISEGIHFTIRVINELGCYETAQKLVKVFGTGPTVFVPTAFTPNNDGRNDLLLPIAVGMSEIKVFRVYNRWGQLVFSTTRNGHGWDGTVNGQPQPTNSYVWYVEAVDFQGKMFFMKGVSTLIR